MLITFLHTLVENFQMTSPSEFFDYAIKKKKKSRVKGCLPSARAGMWAGDTKAEPGSPLLPSKVIFA